MCGIAGIYHFNEKPVEPSVIKFMTDLLRHRGPDDYGFAFFNRQGYCSRRTREPEQSAPDASLAFGHRRLAIIDLAETGAQPMSNGQGNHWIAYNGEIYNYIELRKQLRRLGHSFAGTSDTEVILKAYEQWGSECVQRFNGMWAFALWDKLRKVLFCSRDRVGIKPFYYNLDEEKFIFASEIKAVLASLPREQHQINEPYLARFIVEGLLNDGEDTMFGSVKQLLPGHNLEIANGRIRQWRYWDIPDGCIAQADSGGVNEDETIERLRELLSDAIRLRFRADVPVGMCLSGGLDSSGVVALATRALGGRLSSFTTEYQEAEFSEGPYARRVARLFNTNAHFITPDALQYLDFIDRFCWYHDEPCPGPGPFSQWHVMELASRHVKVVLEGQGADELLGGYLHYYNYYLSTMLKHIFTTRCPRLPLIQYFRELGAIARHNKTPILTTGLNAFKHALYDAIPDRCRRTLNPFSRLLRNITGAELMFDTTNKEFAARALPARRLRPRRYRDDLNEILYWELCRDNLPMLLQYGDRTSMAFSVESRLPYLDYRLIEFVGALPYQTKIKSKVTKYILREALRGLLPDELVDRPDKKGFPTPFALWLKGPLYDYVQDIFNSSRFVQRGIFREDKVEARLKEHCAGQKDHAWLLWRIINIEKWLQVFHDDFISSCQRHTSARI